MYFLASGVYFEEGNYKKALSFLDKAIRVGVDMGMDDQVDDFTLRYALVYKNLGLYGNAINYAEAVDKRVSRKDRVEHEFFAKLILFDLYTALRSTRADSLLKKLKSVTLYALTVTGFERGKEQIRFNEL